MENYDIFDEDLKNHLERRAGLSRAMNLVLDLSSHVIMNLQKSFLNQVFDYLKSESYINNILVTHYSEMSSSVSRSISIVSFLLIFIVKLHYNTNDI